MKISAICLFPLLLLVACQANAGYSDSDILGFYFDAGAGSNCLETSPYVTVPLHLVLTNPSMDALYGYEFGYSVSGSYLVSATELMGSGALDFGGSPGNHIVGLGAPLSPTAATLLATLSIFVMDDKQIQFELHGASPPSIADHPELPVLLLANDTLQNPVLSSPSGMPCARINGSCNPDSDEASWDGVKSLFQ